MFKRHITAFMIVAVIGACTSATDVLPSGYDIEIQSTADAPNAKIRKQAERACATRGEGAHFMSSHPPTGSMYLYVHKYICRPTTSGHAKADHGMPDDGTLGVSTLEDGIGEERILEDRALDHRALDQGVFNQGLLDRAVLDHEAAHRAFRAFGSAPAYSRPSLEMTIGLEGY